MQRELKLQWLLFGAFLTSFGNSFVWPLTTVYIHDQLHQSLTVAGLVLMFFSGANVLGSVLAGMFFDRVRPQRLMVAGLLGAILTMLAMVAWNQWPAYPLLLTIIGFFNGWLLTLLNSFGTRLRGHDGRFIFNMIYFFNNLGMVFGTTIAGPIYELAQNQVGPLFIITASLYAIFILVVIRYYRLPVTPSQHASADRPAVALPRVNAQVIWTLCLGLMLTWLVYAQWSSNMSVYITSKGVSLTLYSLLWTINGLLVITFQLVINGLNKWIKNDYHYVYFGLATIALSFAILLVANNYVWFVLGMVVLTLGETTAFPMIPALVNQLTPLEAKGKYQGLLNAMIAVGKALGPLAGGLVIEALGYRLLFVLCLAVALAITAVVGIVTQEKKGAVQHF
ncbi:MDR family MFS transporter [Limosilactobacillus ingluviei]|uniref:MDR family MFS transporter n=1 Tax=Limosilactobacillus ingluviei TaxID=148604 RepID=UPI0024B9A8B8|nr:MFS transporter [Limosilactobacillus ingluviei]